MTRTSRQRVSAINFYDENVSSPALKGLIKELSYPERLRTLGLPTLEYRRRRADMLQVYKIMKQIDKIDQTVFFTTAIVTKLEATSTSCLKVVLELEHKENSSVTEWWTTGIPCHSKLLMLPM